MSTMLSVTVVGSLLGGSLAAAEGNQGGNYQKGSIMLASGEVSENSVIVDERWGKPVLVYGAALSPAKLEQTEKLMELTDEDQKQIDLVSVNGKDLVKYLGSGNVNANMYSSALVVKGEEGSGVKVNIKTPENITEVTETQYANAMITAGVVDSEVRVASPVKVTGESALTGIYKAYEERGVDLDKDRMAVAQEELETTSDIAKTLKGNEDVTAANLDQALIDIKSKLAKIKDKQGDVATDKEVADVVLQALKDNGLDGILEQEQVDRLVNLAKQYQNTDAIDSAEVKEQLKSLATGAADKLGALKDAAEDSGLLDKVSNFFSELWTSFKGLF